MTGFNKSKVLLLSVLLLETAKAQGGILYLSPGIQFGKSSDGKFFYSLQVTLGTTIEVRTKPGSFHPTKDFLGWPGLTIGLRKYKEQVITFTDVQLSFAYVGAGVGYAWVKSLDGSSSTRGYRTKLWGGFLVNATYDSIKFPNRERIRNRGMIGVLPLPFTGWGFTRPSRILF